MFSHNCSSPLACCRRGRRPHWEDAADRGDAVTMLARLGYQWVVEPFPKIIRLGARGGRRWDDDRLAGYRQRAAATDPGLGVLSIVAPFISAAGQPGEMARGPAGQGCQGPFTARGQPASLLFYAGAGLCKRVYGIGPFVFIYIE